MRRNHRRAALENKRAAPELPPEQRPQQPDPHAYSDRQALLMQVAQQRRDPHCGGVY